MVERASIVQRLGCHLSVGEGREKSIRTYEGGKEADGE